MKYSLFIVLTSIFITNNLFGMNLPEEQITMLAEIKQNLASVKKELASEWKKNKKVATLIEDIESAIQTSEPENRHLFKTHIKYLFQKHGTSVTFTHQNLIALDREAQLMKRNRLSNLYQQRKKQLINEPIPDIPAAPEPKQISTEQIPVEQSTYEPIRKMSPEYWKQKLNKKRLKRSF